MPLNIGILAEAVGIINSGGVLLLQTDTLPGLHGRADDAMACKRIQEIKGRAEVKPMIVLAASLEQAHQVCGNLTQEQTSILERCWPGPFSFILPVGSAVSEVVTGGMGTIAVRVPAFEPLRLLIEMVGHPLASTSANFSGEPPCLTLAAAISLFSDEVPNFQWPNCSIELPLNSQPSALIDLTTSPARQLRPGPLSLPKN